MQKADLRLIVLGVIALVVTGIAFAGSSRWTDEHTVTYSTMETPLGAQGPTNTQGGGARFNWTLPDNATSALVQVVVSFTGQAVQGGSATITIRLQQPDGHFEDDVIERLVIPQGSSAPASIALNVSATWADVPSSVRDVRASGGEPMVWAAPLAVLIVVNPPSDVPLASYSFTASVVGSVVSYHMD